MLDGVALLCNELLILFLAKRLETVSSVIVEDNRTDKLSR